VASLVSPETEKAGGGQSQDSERRLEAGDPKTLSQSKLARPLLSRPVMDWSLVDVDRLAKLACPSCQRGLAGGLMRQLEWTTRRCIVVVACPSCSSDSMVVLETSGARRVAPPIDVDDVRRAHDALERAGRVSDLFTV
jgi:uncharacterized protein YbaR (Trm112 family)